MSRFHLPLTTAISAAILACTGCNSADEWQASSNTRVCTDDSGTRVEDVNCQNPDNRFYRWYYVPRGSFIPRMGYRGGSGTYTPTGGGFYGSAPASAPEGAITRGGFGATGEGHGFGGGGEGE